MEVGPLSFQSKWFGKDMYMLVMAWPLEVDDIPFNRPQIPSMRDHEPIDGQLAVPTHIQTDWWFHTL